MERSIFNDHIMQRMNSAASILLRDEIGYTELLRRGVEDTGRGFDPDSIPQQEVDRLIKLRKTGGLGMRLMKSVMDEVHYEIEPGKKNELHMVKRLKKTE
jgi:anti-sigma regulatory factor (Ser/Thr protein kinase)